MSFVLKMANVPNIVRERLKAAASGANHPDANVLTAFAEKSLSERERVVVLEHLARCGDCRDVLALALPATESASTVVSPSPIRWLIWPALRWGVVAAGVVAVASLGMVQFQRRAVQTAMVAKEVRGREIATYVQPEPAAPAAAASEQKKSADKAQYSAALAASAPAKTPEARLTEPRLAEPRGLVRSLPPAAQAQSGNAMHGNAIGSAFGGPVRRPSASGPKMPVQWQQQQGQSTARVRVAQPAAPSAAAKQQAADMAANANPPQASQTTVEVNGAAPMIAEAQTQQAPVANEITAQSSSEDAVSRVGKAKSAFAPRPEAVVATAHPIARWAISSTGGLQRSFDQGGTWQDVDVTANASAAAMAYELSSSAPALKKDRSTIKTPKGQAAAPIFRAVVATGIDVWAGGSAGALYHSVDGGNRWTRVVPSVAGAVLTGDIVVLEFSDSQHGRVATSTAEVWTTGDNGQSWQKQ